MTFYKLQKIWKGQAMLARIWMLWTPVTKRKRPKIGRTSLDLKSLTRKSQMENPMASLVEIAKTPMHVLWSKSHDNCDQCKAKDATCHKCSKKGLFGLECLSDQSQTKSPQAGSREVHVKISLIKVVNCNRIFTKVHSELFTTIGRELSY